MGESGPQGRKGCGLSVALLIDEMRIPEYGSHRISMLLYAGTPSVSFADCFPEGDAFISYLMNESGLEGFFDAGCDAVCEDVRVVLEQPGVVLVIDEGRFDEDGGHARAAQYGEIRILLDAAVREGRIERADVGDKIFLDADGKPAAGRVNVVAVGFTAASSAGIDMDGEEEIRVPFVGRDDDIGIARGFSH